jgi:hypothetical protein
MYNLFANFATNCRLDNTWKLVTMNKKFLHVSWLLNSLTFFFIFHLNYSSCKHRDAGTTGAAGASAHPLPFAFSTLWVQTMGATGAQNFYNRQN